ncbi:hypothetical protein BJ508DRAFT_411167 [Ascobolus immersus RN42]|uniref:WAP domain-containing protein n=1 Tax=Ascobolus immersus RN42 TaxID=1160509 RepID=A0A3N4IM28_ASCIM|nr:hypothetical protein BJ508DRAFT_411167 [Ascobolus immersus RN42]
MKFISLLSFLLTVGLVSAIAAPEPVAQPEGLEKRACTASDKSYCARVCACRKGQFCSPSCELSCLRGRGCNA